MALATTCPQCKTSFKVVPDQLKLRRGLVRCGVCQHVFSGIDYLRYVDDAARLAQRIARERAGAGGSDPPRPDGGAGQPGRVATTAVSPTGATPTPTGVTLPPTPTGVEVPTAGVEAPRVPAPVAAAAVGLVTASGGTSARLAAAAAATPDVSPAGRRFDTAPPLPEGVDPWEAAARLVHERSRDDDPTTDAFPPGSSAAAAASASETATAARAESARQTSALPCAESAGSTGMRALPAPGVLARPPAPDLDAVLARSTSAWPTAGGPQTLIPADADLKTAFFLPDTAFGPPGSAGPSTRLATADPITLLRPEAQPAAPDDGLRIGPDAAAVVVDAAPSVAAPWPARDARGAASAIDYFAGRNGRSRGLGLALSPVAWAAAALLSAVLLLQAVVGWRDGIAARAPWLAPALGALLSPFGAEPRPPREIDALTIEGFALQATGTPNVLQLSAVLRNRSDHVVGYPAMELTLTDSVGTLLVRKVIPAEAYLRDATLRDAGLPGGTEQPLKLALEHGGLQPTGYAVALFYP